MTEALLQARLRQSQTGLRIASRVTESLLKSADELALLREVCAILVEEADLPLVWIGYGDGDAQLPPLPAAVAGEGHAYVDGLMDLRADSAACPTARVLRQNDPCYLPRLADQSSGERFRQLAERHQLGSLLALPIGLGPRPLGSLALYARQPDGFSVEFRQMLADLARNLSHGIESLRVRQAHSRTALELAESEQRYRTVVEMFPDAILVHSNGLVIFANSAAAAMFHTSPHGLVGRSVYDLATEDGHAAISQRLARPHAPHTPLRLTALRPDGGRVPVEMTASTITFHGRPARILVLRDISQQMQMNEKLVQAAKLSILGEMTAGIIHELSQPLNVIRMTAEGTLLFLERGKRDQDWQTAQFTQIAQQAARTAEIIDDIRIFTRRDSSPETVFDALGPIQSAFSVMEGQIRHHGTRLALDLPAQPQAVRGRRNQLEQVLLNLLSNAHHALKDRDTATSDGLPPTIQVHVQPHGSELYVSVHDNGPGISPAVRDRLFEAFVTTKAAGRGTGLGLSVSYSIITTMGGQLGLKDGTSGACFEIRLPLLPPSLLNHPPDDPAESPLPPALPGHIMVVEDDRTAASTLQDFLRGLGHRVTLCANGAMALDVFRRDPADVVISDLCMPDGGGESLFEQLRDFDPLQPIIIVTGQLEDAERLSDALADDRCAIFKKPVSLSKLSETVDIFLQPPEE